MMSKRSGHLAMFASQVIFGMSNPVSKSLMLNSLDGLSLAYFRIVGAAVLFWLFSPLFPKERVHKRDMLWLLGASVFGVVLNQIPFIVGLSYTSSITVSLLIMLTPMLTMVGAAWVLKEPITLLKVGGVLLGMCGAVLLIFDGVSSGGNNSLLGIMLCLVSCFSFATYLTVFKHVIVRYHAATIMKWMFLFAAIISFPICFRGVLAVEWSNWTPLIYGELGFVILLATFITYLLIPIGQKWLRPTTVSMYNYVQPVVTALLSALLGITVFSWSMGLSALFVFAGVYVVTQSKSRADVLKRGK